MPKKPVSGEELLNEETEVMIVNKNDIASLDLLSELKNPEGNFYCSIEDDGTRKSKVKIYNAVNSASEQLSDHINEILSIVDVAAHPITLIDQNTGEPKRCLRTVLIDENGTAYQAVSDGIASSLQKIFSIVGMPPWTDEPLEVKVKQVKTSSKFTVNTLELV